MNHQQTDFDWSFGLQWLLSCAIGTAVFGMAAYASMWRLAEAVSASDELIRVLVASGLFGAFFALGGTLGPGLLLRGKGISAGRFGSVSWADIWIAHRFGAMVPVKTARALIPTHHARLPV